MKDYCTWFPEKWNGVDISICCKKHDETCSVKKFYKCLIQRIGKAPSSMITIGGTLGCIFRHPIFTVKNYIRRDDDRKNT